MERSGSEQNPAMSEARSGSLCSTETVYIKQEPEDSPGEEIVTVIPRQIKIEIEYEPVQVKQEPGSDSEADPCGDSDNPTGRGDPLRSPGHAADPEAVCDPIKTEDVPQPSKDCGVPAAGSQTNQAQPYVCDICGQTFKEIHHYVPHIQLHEHNIEIAEKKTFNCESCGKSYPTKAGLHQHEHKNFCGPYECKDCGKKFPLLCYLTKHERIHSKPFSCEVCKKRFADSTALVTHTRTHTGEKPYGCDICHKNFGHLSDLTKHKRIHTGEKPYSCDVCKKQFRCSSHLVTHKRIHTTTAERPFSCETCSKQFWDAASLKSHERIHSGEKPFACEVCKKEFTRNSSLITHRRIHTGSGYSCHICKRNFTQSGNLRKHMQTKHDGETSSETPLS